MSQTTSVATTLRGVVGVARPPFLLLPVGLIGVGVAAAAHDGPVDPVRSGLALVGLLALHVSVNALNEAADYRSGIDERTDATPFSGGSKALITTDLEAQTVALFGYATAAVGAAIGAYFLLVVGPVMVPVIAAGAVFVLAYTEYLTRYGLGEIGAGLGLGALPVVGVALVQTGELGTAAVAASVPAFFMTFNLLLLNEFPDVEPDRWGGRANLIHRFGRRRAARLYVGAALAVPATIGVGVLGGALPAFAVAGIVPSIALVRPVGWALARPATAPPVAVLRDNVVWILGTNAALAAGIAVGTGLV